MNTGMQIVNGEPQINGLFAFHKLNQGGQDKSKKIAELYHNFIQDVHQVTFDGVDSDQPNWEGREWAIVKSKLEEACFFSKKAMALQTKNQELEDHRE